MTSRIFSGGLLAIALVAMSGCGAAGSSDIEYAFHLSSQVDAPDNATDELIADIWGALTVDASGDVDGEGTIAYNYAKPCEWEPPYPDDGPAPYCQITGLRDGAFTVSGSAIEWTGEGDSIDEAIFASLAEMGYTDVISAPRLLELTFHVTEIPAEEMLFWGTNSGKNPGETGALALGLSAADVFELPFQISPIIIGADSTDFITDVGTRTFEGEGQVASSMGTLFFVDEVPDGFSATSDEVLEEAMGE